MRTIRDPQMKFGEVDIAAIELDLKSRDDIPPILSGLQYIYATPALRASVFKVLERVIPSRSGPGLSNEDRHRKADPIQPVRYVHAATPLWLKPMYIIRPTSTCSSTPYARRLKNAPGFHGVTSWRAGDNIGTTSGSSKSSIVSSKSSGPPLRKSSK